MISGIQTYNYAATIDTSITDNFYDSDDTDHNNHDSHKIDQVAKLEALWDKGNELMQMVYCFRSVSRAIPEIVSVTSVHICLYLYIYIYAHR